MLTQLLIRNFAIIDEIELDFQSGLTVLTGETGAGKSILVDALQLVIGARAGTEVIRHEAERAEISARFDLSGAATELLAELASQGIDAEDELIVRRIITRDGKSRAFLNGQPVTVQNLREIGEWLADIHGQHDFQSLMRTAAQRALLDRYAGCMELAERVQQAHRQHSLAREALATLERSTQDRDARIGLLAFQIEEIDALRLAPGEPSRLLQERQRLASTGRLAEAARHALDGLHDGEDGNARDHASRAIAALRAVAPLDPRLAALLPPLEEALISLTDGARELSRYLELLEADPARQEALEQRLALIEALARKHRCEPDALPVVVDGLRAELAPLADLSGELERRQAAVADAVRIWQQEARALSQVRAKAALELSSAISARMQTLGMAGGTFQVELSSVPEEGSRPHGLEDIQFWVTANPGQPLRPLAKVASGGELSRLSLAVQVTLAGRHDPATESQRRCMVFDEVDAGVGGAVAEIVGRELAALGQHAQVLCVTHLPQVAALGDRHLKVSKTQTATDTRTVITALSGDNRTEEIARMLGGIEITESARQHAADMLGAALAPRVSPRRARGAGTDPAGNARKARGRDR